MTIRRSIHSTFKNLQCHLRVYLQQVHTPIPIDGTCDKKYLRVGGYRSAWVWVRVSALIPVGLPMRNPRHDHPLAGHFGQNRTLELIRHENTWPGLRTFVKDYVQSCTSCTRAKTPHHRPYGLLKQLPIPEKPWNSISMDFIEQLPSSSSFTAILVVIDRLSKQAIFIPTHNTITSPKLAQFFLLHIFTKHSVPAHVTSD